MPRRDPHDFEDLVDLPLQAEGSEDAVAESPSLDDDLLMEDPPGDSSEEIREREKIIPFPHRDQPAAEPVAAKSEVEDDDEPFAAPEGAAPIGERLLGGLVDLFLQAALVVAAWAGTMWMEVRVDLTDWPPFAVLALVFSFLYSFIPLAFWGQTPGMAWRGHVAVSLDESPLRFGQTTLRWLGSLLTLGLVGLPLLLAFTGRTLSDRLSDSKTLVE